MMATLADEGKYLLLLDENGLELSRIRGGFDGTEFYRFGEPLDIPEGVTITNKHPL